MNVIGTKETGQGFESCMTQRRGRVKPECRVGLPRVVLLAYLLGFWCFICTENPWVGDSHSVYFRLFRYRFELGKLANHSSEVFGLASPQIESSVVSCRRISEVCPKYVLGFRTLCNEPGLRRFRSVYKVEPFGYTADSTRASDDINHYRRLLIFISLVSGVPSFRFRGSLPIRTPRFPNDFRKLSQLFISDCLFNGILKIVTLLYFVSIFLVVITKQRSISCSLGSSLKGSGSGKDSFLEDLLIDLRDGGCQGSIVVEFLLQWLWLALEPGVPLVVPRVMWLRINPGSRMGLAVLEITPLPRRRSRWIQPKTRKALASQSLEGYGEGPTFNFIDRSVAYRPMLNVPEVFMWIGVSMDPSDSMSVGLTKCLGNWTRSIRFGKGVWPSMGNDSS
ncbi:hypothetical protein PIB30_088271 [Stylosanthes scabra]|uniref:Uncharacterized protein n=1 Tax=Stylosanthes scabra TaxID=79078 RepID=A0ABU6RTJ7_9FABA|nr:hypothetical protein [Stylosanthes scabra]